jgi:hypothetical protein
VSAPDLPTRNPILNVVSKHIMSHRPLALGVSLAVHVALVALVVAAAARISAETAPRTIQLNGRSQDRQPGRDLLLDVLSADGVPIHLASTGGDDAVGLAWWSPSVGLWLATDRLPPTLAERALHVAMQVGDNTRQRIGTIAIDEHGSGRIVAAWVTERPAPGTPVTLTISEADSTWRWREPAAMLVGTAAMGK